MSFVERESEQNANRASQLQAENSALIEKLGQQSQAQTVDRQEIHELETRKNTEIEQLKEEFEITLKEALDKQRQSVVEKEIKWKEEKRELQSHHHVT